MARRRWIRVGLLISAGVGLVSIPGARGRLAAGLAVHDSAGPQQAASPPTGTTARQDVPRAAEINLDPTEVEAGMFFDGATVRVDALVPEGLEVAISCVGEEKAVTLNRKGKVLGLIWMNVGDVEIEGAPDLYLLHTSGPLHGMAAPESLSAAGVGYGALEKRITLEGTEGQDHLYFQEFLSLKESDGLYAVEEGSLEMSPAESGRVRVRGDLQLSPKTPPGEYRILVHGFGEDRVVVLESSVIRVRQVGLAATIRILATDHGLLYGVLAVVVAIVVGLLTGVLFGLGSKKAH